MKAITIVTTNETTRLQQTTLPDPPAPGPREILIRWHATSLNYHDYLIAVGAIRVPDDRIPMSDGAGEVIATGADVTEWKSGDKVMSMFFPDWTEGKPTPAKTKAITGESIDGCMCELSCLPAKAVTAIPAGYDFAQAATLPCAALTAWRGLIVEGQLKPGDKVLIEGSGGMSIFALQIAKAAGAKIFATTSSEEKAERFEAMGAEAVVNYKTDERWGKTIFQLSDGGVDHVLDVGGGTTMRQSIEASAVGGHIASIGILGGGRKGELTFPKLFFKHLRITGLAVGSREMQQEMVAGLETLGISPVIDRRFGFSELEEAFRYQASGGHFGKVVVGW